jgi:Uncharacterized protein with an alpha/beta hydrolase fold
MKKLIWLVLLFFLAACGQSLPHTDEHPTSATSSHTVTEPQWVMTTTPTLFIHGFAGGTHSFGPLIQRMEEQGIAKKESTITVLSDGQLQVTGELSGKADNPLIQVLFEDNQSHEWNQAQWLQNVLIYLKQHGIDEVNLVGHSMGGVDIFRYLGTYAQADNVPFVKKFSAIAAPFNDFVDTQSTQTIEEVLNEGPNQFSDRLNDFYNFVGSFALPDIQLIAGQVTPDDLSDGTVPLTSALALFHILKAHGANISYTIVTNEASHSHLHENAKVDQLLKDFLWPQ